MNTLVFSMTAALALAASTARGTPHISSVPRANIAESTVSAALTQGDTCHFFAEESNSVAAGRVKVGPRVRIARDSADLLAQCQAVRLELGKAGCSAIELAGHARLQSLSLANIFGVDTRPGRLVVHPSDPKLFSGIAGCFREIAKPGAAVVFSTCGAICLPDGSMVSYPGRRAAQALLTNSLGMPIISALGPCAGGGSRVRSCLGWYRTDP